MTMGEKIAKLRKDNRYTQEQLAEMLNVSRQAVSKWESDLADYISVALLMTYTVRYVKVGDKNKNNCDTGNFLPPILYKTGGKRKNDVI